MMAKHKHKQPRDPAPAPIRDRLKVPEVAKILNCSITSVYDWAHAGCFPYIRVGKRSLRFDPDVIEAYANGERDFSQLGQVVQLRSVDG